MLATTIILAILVGFFAGAFTVCAVAIHLTNKGEKMAPAGWYPAPTGDMPPPDPATRYDGPLDEYGYPVTQ